MINEKLINFIKNHHNQKQISLVTCKTLLNKQYVKNIVDYFNIENIIIVPSNPSLKFLKNNIINLENTTILATGGGSVIDFSKIIYWLSKYQFNGEIEKIFNHKNTYEYESEKSNSHACTLLAIPSTTGTGSESTKFSTIWDTEDKKKLSFESGKIQLSSFYDINLVKLQTKQLLVSSCFDSLSHGLESIWNINKTPISIRLSIESVYLNIKILRKISKKENLNYTDYEDLIRATTLSGRAIAITKTALSHSISYPITLKYGTSHGLSVGFSLPAVFDFNKDYIKDDIKEIMILTDNRYVEDLIYELKLLFIETQALDFFNESIDSIDNLFGCINEMNNPDRVHNNIRPVSLNDISEIISSSSSYYC